MTVQETRTEVMIQSKAGWGEVESRGSGGKWSGAVIKEESKGENKVLIPPLEHDLPLPPPPPLALRVSSRPGKYRCSSPRLKVHLRQ